LENYTRFLCIACSSCLIKFGDDIDHGADIDVDDDIDDNDDIDCKGVKQMEANL
jgi:hypothetical protein